MPPYHLPDQVLRSKDGLILHSYGFVGFQSVGKLRQSGLIAVPNAPGVYAILRPGSQSPPNFLERSTGGLFKGGNPSVSISKFQEKWVPDAGILYVGKAGGPKQRSTLRSKILTYLEFGAGKSVAHLGGRYIWQLADADDLLVCWRIVESDDSRNFKREMISFLKERYNRLSCANFGT